MKRAVLPLLLAVSLVMVSVAPVMAWGGRGGWHGGYHGGHGGWWVPAAVIGGLALGAAAIVTAPFWAPSAPPAYSPPVTYAPPVAYAPPPTYAPPTTYQQAPNYPPPPQAAAVQREVVYPNGRYVLYGDGVHQPWQWVWVPSASPPPPPAPPQQ